MVLLDETCRDLLDSGETEALREHQESQEQPVKLDEMETQDGMEVLADLATLETEEPQEHLEPQEHPELREQEERRP